MKIGIFASGAGTNLPAIFREKFETAEFVVLISDREKCGAIEIAKKFKIETKFIPAKNLSRENWDAAAIEILKQKKVDLIFLVGFMRILSEKFCREFENKILNVHPSLLPAFAGGTDLKVHAAVLNCGCKVSGATLHFVNSEIDGGEIFAQKACEISENETAESLKKKVQKLEQKMLIDAVRFFEEKFSAGKSWLCRESRENFVLLRKHKMNFKTKKIGTKIDPKKFADELSELFLAAKNKREILKLLRAILTPEEFENLKTRAQIIKLLLQKLPQREIAKVLKISTAKVSRGSRELKFGSGIFPKLFARLNSIEIDDSTPPQNETLF